MASGAGHMPTSPAGETAAGGIRRRQSAPHNDDGLSSATGRPAENPSSPYTIQSPSRTSAMDDNSRPSMSRLSYDAAPRVRFSTDIDFQGPAPRSSMARERVSIDQIAHAGYTRGAKKRPGDLDLTVQTHNLSSDHQGESGSHRSAGLASAISPRNRSGFSPLSPSSRSRGYSLRSALFKRNVEDIPQSPNSDIEMDEGVGSSHGPVEERWASHGNVASPKNGDSVITITPERTEYTSSALAASKSKTGKGPIALPHYDDWLQKKGRGQTPSIVKTSREYIERARKFIFRIKEIPPSKDGRHILLDSTRKEPLIDERTKQAYTSNWIRSTRYSAWNFVPRQLVAQFSKVANFYFLVISILQMIPGLSTTGRFTTIVPLLFFVTVSIAKEGYDDLRRYRLDKAENNREAKVLRANPSSGIDRGSSDGTRHISSATDALTWETTKWQDINVGDVIKLCRNDPAPADLALLHTSGENSVAFVETMALDGETNLKSKQTTASISKAITEEADISTTDAEFVVEDPNRDLYSLEGRVTLDGKQAPLSLNEVIFRGSILRNTPDAIGMVLYTGEECRIRMNANKNPRIKAPSLQGLVNRIVILIVIFVILLSIFNALAYKIWQRHEHQKWYLSSASVAFFPSITSFIIMFNTMIPLSLYVSLEIVKLAQMYFLRNDVDMYDENSNTPCEPRTSTINEELGQISYIFSDKTGTLTDNSMKFRKLSVAGMAWLHDADLPTSKRKKLMHKTRKKGKQPAKGRKSLRSVKDVPLEESSTLTPENAEQGEGAEENANSQWQSSARPGKLSRELRTRDMLRYVQQRPHTPFSRKARMFLLSLALCHTCLPEVQANGETHFMASSPDELALVQAAQDMGFLVINRDVHTITLKIMPSGSDSDSFDETYEIMDVIEFSSKRKRMSIILRFPDGRICIICKGADSIVMQRLRLAALANKNMVDIERRANKRKSMEAQHAIARMSEQIERKSSIMGRKSSIGGRKSLTLGGATRASVNIGRPSMGRVSFAARPSLSARDEMDHWLRARENDHFDVETVDEDAIPMRTPRQSGFERFSMAFSEARSSMQFEDMDGLVDENVAVDENAILERCLQHVNDFASEGLRTLLYGYRFLGEDEYVMWKKDYLEATTSLVNRTQLVEEAGDMIEQNLDLCAATAIEDKLQQGVPEAIDKLRRAKIKMWMLTGDKRETAINIGYSCRLIKDYSNVFVLDHEAGEVEQTIGAAILAINGGSVAHSVVVVDGQTLSKITEIEALTILFLELAIQADSVICCRASPSQKAELVKSIRKRVKKSITLAIGDGANDIAMIQEAHVGIGITGKEGLQAARSSDYSIAQFRFLTKLLLVHGRWNYIRTCKYTVGTFWKEMLFYLTQALYQRSVGYTGTSLYENWSLSFFNTLFTSLPVIFMGVFERDLSASTLLAVPELYSKGQRNGGFNFKLYLGWVFMASAEAMIVYFTMLGLYGQALFTEDNSIFALGSITFTSIVILISLKLQFIETHSKTITNGIAMFLSIGGWFLWNILISLVYSPSNPIYYVRSNFLRGFGHTLTWWACLMIILMCALVLELGMRSFLAAYFTTDEDIFRMLEKDADVKLRFEEASANELQQGWDRKTNKQRDHQLKLLETVEKVKRMEEDRREREVKDMLENRDRGRDAGELRVDGGDIDRVLSRGYGNVRESFIEGGEGSVGRAGA